MSTTREVAQLFPLDRDVTSVGAEGNRLYAVSEGEVAIFETRGRRVVRVSDGVGGQGVIANATLRGDRLKITRAANEGGRQVLRDAIIDLAEGPDHVVFELLGRAEYSEDGAYAFLCEDYDLRRIRVATSEGAREEDDLGPCDGERIQPSADGGFVAIPFGSETQLIRADGQRLILSAMAIEHHVVGYALDPGTGRFELFGHPEPVAGRAPLAYRAAGPMGGATMQPVEGHDAHVPDLLEAFLAGPAPAATAPAE